MSIKKNVDVQPGVGVPAIFHCSQGDKGTRIILGLLNNNDTYTIPEGTTAIIRGSRADGTLFTEITADIDTTTEIKFNLTEDMTSVAGPVECEAVMTSGTANVIGTANFIVNVEKSPASIGSVSPGTDAAETWLVNELTNLDISDLDDESVVDAINSKANESTIAPEFDPSGSYTAGSYVHKNGVLYRFTAAHSGAWTGTDAETVTVGGEITDLKVDLGNDVNLSGWVVGGLNVNTGASNTYNTRSKISISPDTDFISVEAGTNYYVDAYVWHEGVFIGGWDGTTCAKGTDYRLKHIDLIKLIETTQPSAITIVVQNLTNTAINQSDIPNNITFFKPHYATTKKVGALSNVLFVDDSNAWEQGGINVSTGAFMSFSYRIRKKLNRSVSQIFATSGFNFNVFAFDGSTYIGVWDGSDFAKNEKWFTNFLDVTLLRDFGYALYLVGGYSNNASVAPSDGSNITAKDNAIYYTEDKIVMPVLSPNVIYQCRNVDTVSIPPESKWYVKSAYDNQYDRVRFNVRKTTDGHYVLIHDGTINNVAVNKDGTAISATISSDGQSLENLNQYDWGLKYGQQYAGATVPTLEESLKFANAYNLGVTLELHWSLTGSECTDIINICAKYGAITNLILIFQNGYNYASMNYFKTRVPKISYYIGGTEEWITSNIEQIKTLKTAENRLYLQPYPIGTVASDSLINLAVINDCDLYCSWVLSESDFSAFAFEHGYSLMELQGIKNVKKYVTAIADGMI